jgi:abortive infection bacteriophage resistance protein
MERKEQQEPLTIEEQIENLFNLGLTIENADDAKSLLNDVSYFRLVKAYSLGLKPKNGNYYAGTTFNTIVQLYKFNSNFRQELFPIIERIEINLRCRLANYFSVKYGVLGYENPNNFVSPKYHAFFLEDIEQEIRRNENSPFVKNFKDNYEAEKIPFYALVELFSFGTLSKFFKNMKNEDKKAVSATYGVGYTYFESWIESIAFVRNICAHYGRLYNAKLAKTPRLYKQYSSEGIKSIRVFGVLVCMKHINTKDPHWNDFVNSIDNLIKKYPAVKIDTMGFPENWKQYLLK